MNNQYNNQWIDAEKVRWILHKYAYNHTAGQQAANILNDLESLLTPPLPTLAELIEAGNDPQQYQWMQAELDGDPEMRVVIASILPVGVHVLFKDGWISFRPGSALTPLPDLPRLEWPGSGDAPTVAEQENVAPDQRGDSSESPKSSLPRPEDVPAGEPWMVKCDGHKWVGIRADYDCRSWSITRMDGVDYQDVPDSDITLVSRLVPEVGA